jgi:hypothetical protein
MKKQPSNALQTLINMRIEQDKAKFPKVPDYGRVKPNFEDATSNGLTNCIIQFLNMTDGCHAERISSEGRVIDDRKTFENVIGQTVTKGSIKRIKSSGQVGTADISATVLGRSVKIEVKIKDRQSEAQREYQRQIENAKGYYLIAKNFEDFYNWFTSKFPIANE